MTNNDLDDFLRQMAFLSNFASDFADSYVEEVNSPRTRALRRLCKSQLTEVRNTLKGVLDDEEE